MGTTLTALQAGSTNFVYVVAIEGYSYLLTNAPTTAAAVTAWSGTDWSQALGGLYVELDNEQRIHPWEPFQGGGTCTLTVIPDSSDTFGIATHKKSGASTHLDVVADRDDTTLSVKDTSAFAASGTIYIGTEAIAYTGKTATTFTGCTRGKWSPFGVDGGTRFAQHHRTGPRTQDGPKIPAIVSDLPRSWIGKLAGVWMHRVVNGVLDTKAQAQLVFAGRIAELRDDPSTMGTIVELEHILSHLKDVSIGRDLWTAEIKEGVYLEVDWSFGFEDRPDLVSAFGAANLLTVISGTPSGPNEIKEGYYSLSEICSALNAWLAAENAAARVAGEYQFSSPEERPGVGPRTRLTLNIPGAANATGQFRIALHPIVDRFLGLTNGEYDDYLNGNVWEHTVGIAEDVTIYGEQVPLKAILSRYRNSVGVAPRIKVENELGQFFDNTTWLPRAGFGSSPRNGIFVINDKWFFSAYRSGSDLSNVVAITYQDLRDETLQDFHFAIPLTDPDPVMTIRQVPVLEETFADLLRYLFYSTGVAGYNHATYDALPSGCGLNIPGALLPELDSSAARMTGADTSLLFILDRPMKFSDLMAGELMLRWSFPRWKNGGIEIYSWSSPLTAHSVAALDEGTKAAPAGHVENHLSASVLTDSWQKAIVTIAYNRRLEEFTKGDGFQTFWVIQDESSVDESGRAPSITIKARNTFGALLATGQGIEALVPTFIPNMSMFSRPVRWMTRSIDARYFEGYSVGDVVTVTDEFARDPSTGVRGIGGRPAVITRHWYNPGGWAPGSRDASPMAGGVDLFFLDLDRINLYGPGAIVDDTQANAGYNAGTFTLTCYAHKCSESSESADATQFPAGYMIRIIERDPANPASPDYWDREVASQTGNTITLTSALSAPAWDATKKYRIQFQPFSTCNGDQQADFSFHADDVDGLVENVGAPYEYGTALPTGTYTMPSVSEDVELPPNIVYADGTSKDVGHDRAIAALINNLMDYKTAIQCPQMTLNVMSGSGVSGTYKLVYAGPIQLSRIAYGLSNRRSLEVAPFFRSSDGTSASVRITLARTPPVDSDLNDVTRPQYYSETTFTTTSTTWQTPTAQQLTLLFGTNFGLAWIWIECTAKAETRGLALCHEGRRLS